MFSFFKEKPRIEFYNVCDGLEKINPPVPARSEPSPKWVALHAAETKKWLQEKNVPDNPRFSIEKCPAIRGIMDLGFHLKTWQDISMFLNHDGSFKFHLPNQLSTFNENAKLFEPEVQSHTQNQFPSFCNAREDTFSTIIKIVTPWRAKLSPGWVFLLLPIYYSDNPWFSAVPGVWNPEYGRHLNINLQIHKKGGEAVFFPAGISLVKMIPIKQDQKFDFSVRKITEKELNAEKLAVPLIRRSFIPSRKKQREDLEKLYKSKCPFFNP